MSAKRLGCAFALLLGCGNSHQEFPPPQEAPKEAPAPVIATAKAAPTNEKRIVVSAVGDCTLGADYEVRNGPGSFALVLAAHGGDPAYPFSGVREVLDKDDLTIANLETTLTDAPPPAKAGAFQFNGSPAYAGILSAGSVEAVNLANNHSLDMGERGYQDTLAAVEAQKIGAFGNDRKDVRTIKGVEVVNLGFTGGDIKVLPKVIRDVKRAKTETNLVFVSFHWGIEGSAAIVDAQWKLGRAAVDAGADFVIGTHPHVLQGIEKYKGKYILYSLGNFVFGGNSHPADKDSMIVQEVFSEHEGKLEPEEPILIPVSISSSREGNDYRPALLEGDEKDRVLARVAKLSATLPQPR